MNTISLVLNGRTAADIALLPEKQPSSITTIPTRKTLMRSLSELSTTTISFGSAPSSPIPSATSDSGATTPRSPSSGASTPRPLSRPSSSRRSSKDSPGWYYQDQNPTLDDFARRLKTTSKRFEIWQTKCAQNVVMALMRPTPLILFVLNPICLILWLILGFWWFTSRTGGAVVEEG